MYHLWILHYSLIKGIYRRRHKNLSTSADGLAFMCLLFLSLFVFVLVINKELLWEIIRKRFPLGPMFMGILILLTPILIFMVSGRLTPNKVRIIRKVIERKNKIKRAYSMLYVGFFVVLFVLTMIIAALSRTPL